MPSIASSSVFFGAKSISTFYKPRQFARGPPSTPPRQAQTQPCKPRRVLHDFMATLPMPPPQPNPPSTVPRPQADRQLHPAKAKAKPNPHPFARLQGQQTCLFAAIPPRNQALFFVYPSQLQTQCSKEKKANKCSLKQNSIRRSMWCGGKRQNRKATRRISPSPRFRSSRSSDEAQAIRPHRCRAEISSTCEGGTARLQSTLPPCTPRH